MKNKIASIIVISALATNLIFVSFANAEVSARTLIDLTNQSRLSSGLSALKINPQLQTAAQAKANDMFKNSYFDHFSPSGLSPWDFIKSAGYTYVWAGENLAINFSETSDVHNALIASPSHRENILSPHFTEVGIATLSGLFNGRQTTVVVEMFGSRSTQGIVVKKPTVKLAVLKTRIAQKPVFIQISKEEQQKITGALEITLPNFRVNLFDKVAFNITKS